MVTREQIWHAACADLARERSLLVERSFRAPLTTRELRLVRHLERERDYYQMKLMAPAFQRLEGIVRSRQRLARKIDRLVARGRTLAASA